MMLEERLAGNAALKQTVARMMENRRLTHSLLLIGEPGLGAGFAARCIAADYLFPQGGAPAEALLRGDCCHAMSKSGKRDEGWIETGIVREAVCIRGLAKDGGYLVGQVIALRKEIYNTGLSAAGRVGLLYNVEKMNKESANALLKAMEEPPDGVLFLLTASSLAGVLPTVRSRCVSLALAPAEKGECAEYCVRQGVERKQAALLSTLFDGRIGAVLAAAKKPDRRARLDTAHELAQAAACGDKYTASIILAQYEKDRLGAVGLLEDLRAYAAAGLHQESPQPALPLAGDAAARVLRRTDEAIRQLNSFVNVKAVLQMLAIRICADD